jgi:hypothetical protein
MGRRCKNHEEMKNAQNLSGRPQGLSYLRNLGVEEMILLEWILKK